MRDVPALASLAFALLLATAAHAEDAAVTAKFACADDKSIAANFGSDNVELSLSDGREMTLPQVISGSGARYANSDESVVFWNKGNTAFITEGPDETMTYADCTTD